LGGERARCGRGLAAAIAGAVLAAAPPIAARAGDDAAEIRAALTAWTAAFNAGDADRACRLFAPDLRYDVRGLPEQTYDEMCRRLHRAAADTSVRYRYAPAVKEVLVAGDLAVVRLAWHVTTTRPGQAERHTVEQGMDVFRREPDGGWRIIRYLAYEAPP
jgi:steroid delta-isomerase